MFATKLFHIIYSPGCLPCLLRRLCQPEGLLLKQGWEGPAQATWPQQGLPPPTAPNPAPTPTFANLTNHVIRTPAQDHVTVCLSPNWLLCDQVKAWKVNTDIVFLFLCPFYLSANSFYQIICKVVQVAERLTAFYVAYDSLVLKSSLTSIAIM